MRDSHSRQAVRVVVVDDHALVRAGIVRLLDGTRDITVVGEAADGEEALAAVDALRPDLVLMDLSMPKLSGAAATRRLRERHPGVRVLVLSSYADRTDVLEALDAGAVGYLLKESRSEELLAGIRAALGDGAPLAPKVALELISAWRKLHQPSELTTRELDVLILLGEGLPNKVIAQRLGITEKTVKAHVTHIFEALGVTDRTQAALWVARHGLPPRQPEGRDQPRASDTARRRT
jgi:DNA-binding NarL/FixJ family response regulator